MQEAARRGRWVPVLAGIAAVAVALLTARGRGRQLDLRLCRAMNRARGHRIDAFFTAITELGSIWASVGAAAVMVRRGRAREGMDALGAAGVMWALGQVAKKAVLRPRPYEAVLGLRMLIAPPQGTSWPSSHPAVLLTFVSVATRDLAAPLPARAAAGALAAIVGLSRIYVGVHYPADVAGGLLLGRGVSDLWSAVASPAVLGRVPHVVGARYS